MVSLTARDRAHSALICRSFNELLGALAEHVVAQDQQMGLNNVGVFAKIAAQFVFGRVEFALRGSEGLPEAAYLPLALARIFQGGIGDLHGPPDHGQGPANDYARRCTDAAKLMFFTASHLCLPQSRPRKALIWH